MRVRVMTNVKKTLFGGGGYNRAVALTDSVIVTRFLQGQARQIPAKTEEDGQKTQPLVEDLLAFDSF